MRDSTRALERPRRNFCVDVDSSEQIMHEKTYWLDSKKNVTKIYWGVWIACAALLAAELFVHLHGHFSIESVFGFYGLYGFIGCVGLVLGAKVLRVILMRPEDYYDE